MSFRYPHSMRYSPPSSAGDERPQSFPTKWATLPGINGPRGLDPEDSAIVPYTGSRSAMDQHGDDKMRQLETRVNVAERSNRALLEEVVRLQGEMKGQMRQSDKLLREEQSARKSIEQSLRSSNELISTLTTRLQKTEEKVNDEHLALTSLVSHSKSIEEAVMGSQKEMLSRRDVQASRIAELRNQLDEAHRHREGQERITFQMVDELRNLKARVDTQSLDFAAIAGDLKNKSRRLEEENRVTLDTIRKQGEHASTTEQTTSQLRNAIEARMSELRDVIVELRQKQEQETQERRMLEQQIQLNTWRLSRVGDVHASINEQNRRREEALHKMESLTREKDHQAENEKIKLQSRIGEIAEEVSKKILQKEIKLREESQLRYAQIEQMLRNEGESRQKFERDLREQMEERWESLQKLHNDELLTSQEQHRSEKRKQNETLHKLNDALNLVDKQLEEFQKKQNKLISAEVASRKQHEKGIDEQIENLHDKVNVATATMQQAIGGLTLQLTSQQDRLKQDMRELMDNGQGSYTRNFADMDARIVALGQKLTSFDEQFDAKIQAASTVQAQNVREKIESVSLWQGVTSQTLKEIQSQNTKTIEDVHGMKERHALLRGETESKIKAESDSRAREIEDLKIELERLVKNAPSGEPTKVDNSEEIEADQRKPAADLGDNVYAIQQSIRKLAESIQTVKTVLGMKIQSEGKLREKDLVDVRKKMDKLKRKLDKLEAKEGNQSNNANNNNSNSEGEGDGDNDKKDDDKDKDKDDDKKSDGKNDGKNDGAGTSS